MFKESNPEPLSETHQAVIAPSSSTFTISTTAGCITKLDVVNSSFSGNK